MNRHAIGRDGSRRASRVDETENALTRRLPNTYASRPGFLRATPEQRRLPESDRLLGWTFPIVRAIWPRGCCAVADVGLAMIRVAIAGGELRTLDELRTRVTGRRLTSAGSSLAAR